MKRIAGWIGALGSAVAMLPALAAAEPIAGSSTQVGAWRVTAYTRGPTGGFGHCALYRVQSEGFGLAIGYTAQGVWSIAAEAPDWDLTVRQSYTATLQVGGASYTAAGRAFHARGMTFNIAPEIFGELKSGQQLSVTAHDKRYVISLDGIEAAVQRTRDCVRQYASATPPAASASQSAAPAPPPAQAPTPPPAVRERTTPTGGTGFHIAPDIVVTAFHVINGCSEVRLSKAGADLGPARVLASSRADDLAALRPEGPAKGYLKLRVGAPIRPAEPVMVFGYPLGSALSSSGNTTLGNVTALTGLRDDSRYIQISAAVQPGNSGGPAVDEAGRLIGVVVSKLNALAVARITGDIPQNVNFAIKASTLAAFLEANQVAYETADPNAPELPVTQRAERAEAASTKVECRK